MLFRNNKFSSERGATMVEMSIALVALMGIVGVLFDLGLGLHRYMMLTNVTQDAAREMATELVTTGQPDSDCESVGEGTLRTNAFEAAKKMLTEKYGLQGNYSQDFNQPAQDFYFDASFKKENTDPDLFSVTVKGKMRLTCIFCNWLPRDLTVSVSSQGLVNSTDFSCFSAEI